MNNKLTTIPELYVLSSLFHLGQLRAAEFAVIDPHDNRWTHDAPLKKPGDNM